MPGRWPGQQLVLAHANRGELDPAGNPVNPTDGHSPWVIRHLPTPSTGAPIHVGPITTGVASHNLIFVLTYPAARQLRYAIDSLPYAKGALPWGQSPTLYSSTGVFLADAAVLDGPLSMALIDDADRFSPAATLGLYGRYTANLRRARRRPHAGD